ncbi:uncharacterized protein [Watersipora subatra]|uniref:uncharacterized protein n=1 Tax=Watersipora subatra TaxID=2589382 RepID=UPI00355B1764
MESTTPKLGADANISSDTDDMQKSFPKPAIMLCLAGALLLIIMIAVVIVLIHKKRKQQRLAKEKLRQKKRRRHKRNTQAKSQDNPIAIESSEDLETLSCTTRSGQNISVPDGLA